MGNYNTKKISISLFLLSFIIIAALAFPTSAPSVKAPLPQTDFKIKKTSPTLSNRSDRKRNLLRGKRLRREKMAAKKMDSRRFSAMLPKGYVPPSGSSPCHNVYPNSVSFFCDFANQMQKP